MQQKDSLRNIKSCNASTAATMAIKQQTISDNQDAANAAKSTTTENAKVQRQLLTAFNAKDLMKPWHPQCPARIAEKDRLEELMGNTFYLFN